MSKFIPHAAVSREQFMQHMRRQNGLKSGAYQLWPDLTVGPLIVLTHKIEALNTNEPLLKYWQTKATELLEKTKTLEAKNDQQWTKNC